MSDEADIAAHQEELARQAALIVRHRVGPRPNGRCLNCGELIDPPLRWCDSECREDWTRREDK